jgi:hypothetical protein
MHAGWSADQLLVTGASVLISYLYVATIHYVYIPLWSWVNPQLVINLVSELSSSQT